MGRVVIARRAWRDEKALVDPIKLLDTLQTKGAASFLAKFGIHAYAHISRRKHTQAEVQQISARRYVLYKILLKR